MMDTKGNPTSICHMNTTTYGSKINLKSLKENVFILRFRSERSEKQPIFLYSTIPTRPPKFPQFKFCLFFPPE